MSAVFRLMYATVLCLALITKAAKAGTNILFILDYSGSMAGNIDGKSKIATAQAAVSGMLNPEKLPEGAKLGMMLFGHRSKTDCHDVEITEPIGSTEFNFKSYKPLGRTPLAYALQQSAAAFKDVAGQNNNVVLISEGIESCEGDPCAASAALAAADIGLRVHVVGFSITPHDREQLQCIADKGRGQYFSAESGDQLSVSLNNALAVAQTAPIAPEPVSASVSVTLPETPPEISRADGYFFSDDFEGQELSADNWDVMNPNVDGFLVENGTLLTLSSKVGGLEDPTSSNLFALKRKLPPSDYVVTLKFQVVFATGVEKIALGLLKDKDNYIEAAVYAHADCCYPHRIDVQLIKLVGGQKSEFTKPIFSFRDDFVTGASAVAQPITLKLIRKGRQFTASANFEGQKDDAGQPLWTTTEPLTVLRSPETLVVHISQMQEVKGETTFALDSLTVEAPKQ